MTATADTVRIVLLTNARTSRKSRFWSTVAMFSKSTHSVGQLNSRNDASAWVLPAVKMMKANGTRNTTIAMRMATLPPPHFQAVFLIARPPSG